jgi:hypothetical protein
MGEATVPAADATADATAGSANESGGETVCVLKSLFAEIRHDVSPATDSGVRSATCGSTSGVTTDTGRD